MGWFEAALSPLSAVYGAATHLRNICYDTRLIEASRSTLPVICVGNVTAGGNGKTPLVEFLATSLTARRYCPVVLSRGYGGTHSGPHSVHPDDPAELVGDEPVMLRRKGIPVVIARNRVLGARMIEQGKLGDCILLDDGLQHRRLARDLNIVSIDASSNDALREFVSGELLPLGRFRESWRDAKKRISAVVLSFRRPRLPEDDELDLRVLRSVGSTVPIFRSWIESAGLRSADGTVVLPRAEVIAVCAIGNPHGFLRTVELLGAKIVDRVCLADHRPIPATTLNALRASGKMIVTTEKDLARLAPAERSELFVPVTRYVLDRGADLLELVQHAIEKRRSLQK